jgi:g-D-glutamyl-meso-diaminopimelate peptidase
VSGYSVEETPYSSGFAGYKDWFIESYNLPGYTIEIGLGMSPLPLSQFPQIYKDNLGILVGGITEV